MRGSLFHRTEAALAGSDQYVKAALVVVIIVAVFLLLQPSRTARLAGAAYFVLP